MLHAEISCIPYSRIFMIMLQYKLNCLQGREMDTRCTIYKKTDEIYQLKLKASRMFYSEVIFIYFIYLWIFKI